jgi:cytochrome b561
MTAHRPRTAHSDDRHVEPRRFDAVTIALHWTTVALIAGLFASVWLIGLVTGDDQAKLLLTIHRSLGVLLWIVAISRLGWRLTFAFLPPFPPTMSKIQQTLAKVSEYGLYALLLVQPFTGMAQSLTRGRAFPLLGGEVPILMARDKGLTASFHQIHEISAWVLLGLIGVHVLAALFHRFVLRDEVLQSMMPFQARRPIVAPGEGGVG